MNIDGIEYVTKQELDAMALLRDEYRKTLALAHAKLFDGDPAAAVRVIRKKTGWTYLDAQAVLDVITEVAALSPVSGEEPKK